MYSSAKVIHTTECDKCKNKIVISEASYSGQTIINLSRLSTDLTDSCKDVLGYTLCWKCFEEYRDEWSKLYSRLHRDVFGYDPRPPQEK